ncbi:MAG TPA: efflux transporter outer membrane subunit [Steroidobacteraceae bacterium]|nr:efflux transporter outer membrane subunit [Gammaproteobacteria bacterium]HEV2284883.1 efflux transporter outer membrane subunit [Steroidobacteraceae bacterium]
MKPPRIGIATVLAAVLGGCAVGPSYHTPNVATPERYAAVPAATGAEATTAAAIDPASWWKALQDPELDSLIERAVAANPDVLVALDRLQAARVFEAAVIGTVLPDAEASGGAGRGTGGDLTRGRAAQPLISADNTAGYQHLNEIGGFDSVWELDIFGKYRREIQAARYDEQATRAARYNVLVSVIADVARSYVDLRGLQVRAAVLDSAIMVLRESLRIVSIRYERGITNELDVTLATRELATLEAQAAPINAQVRAAEYSLATLLGLYPEDLVKELSSPGMVPVVPDAVDTGLPPQLLRRRPDIEEAERQLAGATARIGIATADLFPSLALTGAVGFQRQSLKGQPVLGEHIWSVGPAAVWPLLDFGALDAQVEIADLQTRALLVRYKQSIQEAVREVDTSYALFGAEQQSISQLSTALVAGQRAVTLANERYERGVTDFLNVVDAERQEYEIEEQFAATQVAAAEQYIELYRSLGGGWENYQKVPAIHRPEPAIIAVFQRTLSRSNPLK